MLDQLISAAVLYPLFIILFMISVEAGIRIGLHVRGEPEKAEHMRMVAVSTLGLVALLLAFSLSHSLSRYETRRELVVEEANAIASTAHLALMLPVEAQVPILNALRAYVTVRTGLGIPYDPTKLKRDAARSADILGDLWRKAVSVSEPRSLAVHRFVESLDEMTRVQEKRLDAYRYHVPDVFFAVLVSVSMVALGFTGYQAGLSASTFRAAYLIMAGTIAIVIVLVIDLDQPARGLIQVPADPLVGVAQTIESLGPQPISKTASEQLRSNG